MESSRQSDVGNRHYSELDEGNHQHCTRALTEGNARCEGKRRGDAFLPTLDPPPYHMSTILPNHRGAVLEGFLMAIVISFPSRKDILTVPN